MDFILCMGTAVQNGCIDSCVIGEKIFSIESFEAIQLQIKSKVHTSSRY